MTWFKLLIAANLGVMFVDSQVFIIECIYLIYPFVFLSVVYNKCCYWCFLKQETGQVPNKASVVTFHSCELFLTTNVYHDYCVK